MSADNLDDDFDAPAPVAVKPPTREDILGALKWSAPREVATKLGPRLVSSADADETVFALWRQEKDSLKSAGYSLGEFRGKWQISKWEKLPEKIVVSRENAKALSRATDADINVPAPDGLAYLGYQRAGIAYAYTRRAVLFGDEPGLGKTIQAIGVLNCKPELRRILVICPASLKLNWRRELEKWLVRKRPILVADGKTFVALADGIVIVNYDVLNRHLEILRSTEWHAIISDEAHLCKNPKAIRTKCIFGYRPRKKDRAKGDEDQPALTAHMRMLLTGTPITNRPIELYPLIAYLDGPRWSSYWKFAQRYCGASEMNGWDTSGASNLEELQTILRETVMVRRLKKDVLTELPPKRRQVVEFPADTPALRAVVKAELNTYQDVDDLEAEVELAAASDDPNVYEAAVSKLKAGMKARFEGLSELRRATAEAKIPFMIDFIEEAVEESSKVVVFAHHKSVVAAIAEKFGDACVQIVGDTPNAERQANADRFQKDPSCSVIIGSIGAMGVGWTLTASARLIMCELDWVPGNVSQAEDRCHRIGQRESLLVQHLVLEGSLDATIARRIISKQEVIDKALDVVAAKKDAPAAEEAAKRPESVGLAALAERMTDDQRDAACEAIVRLRAMCDGAGSWDGSGFSKVDVRIGHSLANQAQDPRGLSKKQAALAQKVSWKYRGQLPDELVERLRFKETPRMTDADLPDARLPDVRP